MQYVDSHNSPANFWNLNHDPQWWNRSSVVIPALWKTMESEIVLFVIVFCIENYFVVSRWLNVISVWFQYCYRQELLGEMEDWMSWLNHFFSDLYAGSNLLVFRPRHGLIPHSLPRLSLGPAKQIQGLQVAVVHTFPPISSTTHSSLIILPYRVLYT